jgi:hypothetical protein
MNPRVIPIILALLACLVSTGLADENFEYGLRPPKCVFDPAGVLEPDAVSEISAPLVQLKEAGLVDVVAVVLTSLGDAPPEHVARRFAAAWCSPRLHAVVLHVPGHDGSPWIVPGGDLIGVIQPDKINAAVAAAVRRATREPTDAGKVRAASVEAADMLRYWIGTAINRSEYLETERTRMRLELESKARLRRILLLSSVASIIPVLAGCTLLFVKLRPPGPRRFPETKRPRRLGAPYCGGNHAEAAIGPPIK